jgi:two-component system sensor histidine kinase YesM
MKLKQKYLIIFILISTIPILIITFYTYNRYTTLVKQQTTQVAESVFDNAVEITNRRLEDINYIAGTFQFYSESSNSIIEELKKFTKKDGSYTTYDLFKSRNNIKFIIDNFLYYYKFINAIFVFTPSGEVLGSGYSNIDVKYGYEPYKDNWYQNTIAKQGGLSISGISTKDFILNAKPSISISVAIYDVYSKVFLGVLLIDCSPDLFNLSSVNTLPDLAMLAIENEDGNILYSNINDIPGTYSQKNTVTKKENLNNGLTMISVLDYSRLYSEFGVTQILIIIIGIICALIAIVLSFVISNSLTKPIIYLSNQMASKHNNNALITKESYLKRNDEVGTMYNEYNTMVERESIFIKQQYTNKLIALDAQMKSLEAQINSHFLYNTLESINSIAEIEEIESISTMTLALGSMFRYSIKTKNVLVTTQEELKHVNDYVTIQKLRFDNKFDLRVDIPKELFQYKVLKLILQPLVENALLHGLQHCRFGNSIDITGYIKENTIYFEVTDNGVGMTEKQTEDLEKLLSEEAQFTELGQRNDKSIGLKNIHSRIALYYGLGYGLTIMSKPDVGTTVTIKLPIVYHMED